MNKFQTLRDIFNGFNDNDDYCYYCQTYFKEKERIMFNKAEHCPFCLSSKIQSKYYLKTILEYHVI